jgi:hypothetical protein
MNQLTLIKSTFDGNTYVTDFACNLYITCTGDSIWKDEKNPYKNGKVVHVKGISIIGNDASNWKQINVKHNKLWTVYTDTGFANEISKIVGFDVDFTEQGMQNDYYATLEGLAPPEPSV